MEAVPNNKRLEISQLQTMMSLIIRYQGVHESIVHTE